MTETAQREAFLSLLSFSSYQKRMISSTSLGYHRMLRPAYLLIPLFRDETPF